MNPNEIRIINDNGKSLTLADLMNEYGQDVWNFAFFLTRKKDLADDIFQEVFINAYLHFDNFRGEASVKSWLFIITRNKVSDYKKSAFIRKVTLIDKILPGEKSLSAEEETMKEFVREEIWRHVLRLPEKQREILVLYAHYEMSLGEIARILKIPVGTAKSRLHKARKHMIKRMEEQNHEFELGERFKTI